MAATKVTLYISQSQLNFNQRRSSFRVSLKETFCGKFQNEQEEHLYQQYMRRQKLKIIPHFTCMTVLYLTSRLALEMVVATGDSLKTTRLVLNGMFIFLTVLVLLFLKCRRVRGKRSTDVGVVLLWALFMSSLLVEVILKKDPYVPSGLVGWVQVIIFSIFVVVPWRLEYCVGMGLLLGLFHSMVIFFIWYNHDIPAHSESDDSSYEILLEELIANALLFLGTVALGILVYVVSEKKQRHSFLESKKSHVINNEILKEHKEQMRLLQSVLPKYVAGVMMRDIVAVAKPTSDEPFRKIYMQRFEDVSILFADIVGFTAISSSVTAGELVKILNQLFANFDSLGRLYHQERIKILGDCYYCVCGINKVDIRPDHAVLSIHMGMSMVDAINVVRRDTGKDVNMRVGIHTGSVLAGVIGQKQWQYDVLGQQVIMANHLESGGLPARVHISETTKAKLDGQFELEPGNGHDRDDYIKLENMETYLIKSIIKKFPDGTLDANPELLAKLKEEAAKNAEVSQDSGSSLQFTRGSSELSLESQHYTLKDALFDKKRSRMALEQMNKLTLWFHKKDMELRYRERTETLSGVSLGSLGLVLALSFSAKSILLPVTVPSIIVLVLAEVILMSMALVSSMSTVIALRWIPEVVVDFGHYVEGHGFPRIFWGLFAIFVLFGADSAMIWQCELDEATLNMTNTTTHVHDLIHENRLCVVPTYFAHVVPLVFLSLSAVVQVEHMTKMLLILVCSVVWVCLYILYFYPIFDSQDSYILALEVLPSKYDLSVQLLTATLAIIIINRKMEEISRRMFVCREEAESKMGLSHEEHGRTEGLIYNILPEHVARYFIGHQRDHMDLYHHAYDDVAVMFAACPNFHDFYNESAINNQGLECLRLLHEIISDYDELLDKPRFKNSITKIKTVGPTYMAAAGMITPLEEEARRASTREATVVITSRYQHVDDMVQFALAMKEELRKINEQSFNTFLLRIGINNGPIIAGVIGVTKPHYDIWGNTVNVASRMETTSPADNIQVEETTKEVLEAFGYLFEKRGRIKVKGKGELMTYFLVGQDKSLINKWTTKCAPISEGHETDLDFAMNSLDINNQGHIDSDKAPSTCQSGRESSVEIQPGTAQASAQNVSGPGDLSPGVHLGHVKMSLTPTDVCLSHVNMPQCSGEGGVSLSPDSKSMHSLGKIIKDVLMTNSLTGFHGDPNTSSTSAASKTTPLPLLFK